MGESTFAAQLATPHEFRVLQAVVNHDCVRSAAHTLGISPITVRNHLANLRRKSGRSNLAQLWQWAQSNVRASSQICGRPPDSGNSGGVMLSARAQWTGVSEEQWAQIVRVFPDRPAKVGPGRRPTEYRKVVNGILYKLFTGCSWGDVPSHFCTRSTGSRFYREWLKNGVWPLVWREFYELLPSHERKDWAVRMMENGCVPTLLSRQ